MTDREKFLNTARSYIGKDGYYVCKTKLGYDAVYDWCAFAVSAIMKDCGFIGKYTRGVHSFASDEGRYGDGSPPRGFSYTKATPHKDRLAAWHHICLLFSRHLTQKSLDNRQVNCGISIQSDEKIDCASAAPSLCGILCTA